MPAELEIAGDDEFLEIEPPQKKLENQEPTPDQKRIQELEEKNRRQEELFEKLASRPVDVRVDAPVPTTPTGSQDEQLSQLKKFVDENLLAKPGETLLTLLYAMKNAMDETYMKPAQLERAKDWAETFLDRKRANDRLYKVVAPLYEKHVSVAGNSLYQGTRAEVFSRLENLWKAAAGDIAYRAAQEAEDEDRKKRQDEEARRNAPPKYTSSNTGKAPETGSTKVRIPASFVSYARRTGLTKNEDIIELWQTPGVAENWGKSEE